MSFAFSVGSHVFVNHPTKSWIVCTVISYDEKKQSYTVVDDETNEKISNVGLDSLLECRTDLLNEGIDPEVHDLLLITVLNEASLLRCLYVRFMKDIVYTNIGSIVIAINPFSYKIPWYQNDMMDKYLEEKHVITQNLPHSWAIAHNTYYEMRTETKPHTILISGESGAGKTEASKIVIKYLCQISSRNTSQEHSDNSKIYEQTLSVAPILEGFGNAKTVRNNNSSRFGKFVKITFHPSGFLSGSYTTPYLLEKSRVITASNNERIYHSFYYLTKGVMSSTIGLKGPKFYKSTNSGNCLDVEGMDDSELFDEVSIAFTKFGLNDSDQLDLWKIVGGCIVCQEVTFSEIDADSSMINENCLENIKKVCKLWGLSNEEKFKTELVSSTIVILGEVCVMKHKLIHALDARDSLCKQLYEKLFLWIINYLNSYSIPNEEYSSWIGILDIFGFEDFEHNSFEQLCINLANENLQNQYVNYIFKQDLDDWRAEGLHVDDIKYTDNAECLKLISDDKGIMALLDDESLLVTGSDSGFFAKINQFCSKSQYFYSNPLSRDTFMIRHYAGNVTYIVTGFVDKNRDNLKEGLKILMTTSTNKIASTFFSITGESSKSKLKTIGGYYNLQLKELMKVIHSTSPHWIRCIKPNPQKKPKIFDTKMVAEQLLSSGVLDTVKIRKAGYPVRMNYPVFLGRYKVLFGSSISCSSLAEQQKAAQKAIATAEITPGFAQLGKTRVFMKSEAYSKLEKTREIYNLKYYLVLQATARSLFSQLIRRQYLWKQGASLIQKELRDYLHRSTKARKELHDARQKILSAQAKEKESVLNEALKLKQNIIIEEDDERKKINDTKKQFINWVLDKTEKDINEIEDLKHEEMKIRWAIVLEKDQSVILLNKILNALHILEIPEKETIMREKIIIKERREFTILFDLFTQFILIAIREELQRVESRYRRFIINLQNIQFLELFQRMQFYLLFLKSFAALISPHLSKLQAIKMHAFIIQRQTLKLKENISLNYDQKVSLSNFLSSENSPYRRLGDKIEPLNDFSAKEPWVNVNGIPDIDQIVRGRPPYKKKNSTFWSSNSEMTLSSEEEEISFKDIKRGNVFEIFKNHSEEVLFLYRRHLIAKQFRFFEKNYKYKNKFSDELSIFDQKTLQIAIDLLHRISIKFSEETVQIMRPLNEYCISRKIPEKNPVTGYWQSFSPVPACMLKTFPVFPDWKKLLKEEKRLEKIVEEYRLELLNVIFQCEEKGAKLGCKITKDSPLDSVIFCYFQLKGNFDHCVRCLYPVASKQTLIQMQISWPRVSDAVFPNRCIKCMSGGI